MKKIKIPAEILYLIALVLLAFSVSMIAAADFGVSMIVAPAYIVSLRFPVLTFGQSEYVVQGLLFIVLCLVMRKVKLVYFFSFVTGLLYGAVLDAWRAVIPLLNPAVTPPGSMALPVRIVLFVVGVVLTSFSVALFFHTYLYPQVYDFFVKAVSTRKKVPLRRFKTAFDACCLVAACAMTLLFFGGFRGVGWGTLLMTVCNGTLISLFDKWFTRRLDTTPVFEKISARFDLNS